LAHSQQAGRVRWLSSCPVSPNELDLGGNEQKSSALRANRCHHPALVRSGTSAMPLPWSKNFCSHGTSSLSPPNGAFIQTYPCQGRSRLLAVMNDRARIHGVTCCPGLATSVSKVHSNASST